MKFVVYDNESTGSDPRFDQPIQYAAIATDANLNPQEEVDLRCRPDPHILPHPMALLVTGNRYSDLMKEPASHYEMMRAVAGHIRRWSPAIFVGHNILRFDEEMQRHSFYKTLQDPYLTSKSGCGRLDSLNIMRFVKAVDGAKYSWPTYEDGRPSFKLEELAPANGITDHNAHDALGDVRVNLKILQLVQERSPELWKRITDLAFRNNADAFMKMDRPFLFCPEKGDVTLKAVIPLARNPNNKNELLAVDLEHGYECANSIDEEAGKNGAVKSGESGPFVRIRLNRCPMLLPLEESPREFDTTRLWSEAEKVKASQDLFKKGLRILAKFGEGFEQSDYVEDKLYGGFFSRKDEYTMRRYHDALPGMRPSIATEFEDQRLKNLSARLVHIECAEFLPEEVYRAGRTAMVERIFKEGDVPWVTHSKAVDATRELMESGAYNESSAKMGILQDYMQCLEGMRSLTDLLPKKQEVPALSQEQSSPGRREPEQLTLA